MNRYTVPWRRERLEEAMADERVARRVADEVDEVEEVEEFTGEELQVAPDGDDESEGDDESADDGDESEGDDDESGDANDESADDDDDDDGEVQGRVNALPIEPPAFRRRGVPAQQLEARDPTEVLRDLHFGHMTDRDQAEALRAAGGKPENSVDRARRDILQERELAARAVAYREWPEEFQGKALKGRVRSWKAPFSVAEIEDWLATYRGGGKYKIQLYMGNGRYLDSKVLDVEGDPLLPGAREDAEEQAREKDGAYTRLHDDRAAALERQLAEERFERRMSEERGRTDGQMGAITNALQSLAEAMRHRPEAPVKKSLDVAELATAFGPLVMAYLASQDNKASEAAKAAREDRKYMLEQQNAAEKRMGTLLTQMAGKKESLADTLKILTEAKKLTGGDNVEAKAFSRILDTALPKLIDATTRIQLHRAGVDDDKEEEFGAKMVVDRITDLASTFLSSRSAAPPAYQQQQQQPPPQQPQAPALTHGAYGMPVQQQPQRRPPSNPIVTPEQQAAHEAAQRAAREHGGLTLEQQQQALLQQQAAQQYQAAQQHAALQASAQQQPYNDVNFSVFDRALQSMQVGKMGSELADELMREEQAHQEQNPGAMHLYLSPRVVQFLCSAQPPTVLAMLNPQIAGSGEARFQALLDAIGQQFLEDFCFYFSQPGDVASDDDDGDGDDDTDLMGGKGTDA